VVIGVETAIADDPELNVRLDGYFGPQPARVVLDSRQRLPLQSRLVRTAREQPALVISTEPATPELTNAGVRVLTVASTGDGRPDLGASAKALAADGLQRLLVEGGGQVAASFLRCGLVDRIEWFRAPLLLGGEGRAAIGALEVRGLGDAPRFRRVAIEGLGDDLWERYERL
jgi:diaminohydroxyphosphoribosylaminopyrimidine deaminase/5-amino-6-(5-phosphoribosylamino)uracil reductase